MSTTTAASRPRRPRRPVRPDPRALLEAARRLFAEKGFAATGREEIAAQAGVTGRAVPPLRLQDRVGRRGGRAARGRVGGLVVTAARQGKGVRDQLRRGPPRPTPATCALIPPWRGTWAMRPAVLGMEACRALDAVACAPLLAEVFARAEEEEVGRAR